MINTNLVLGRKLDVIESHDLQCTVDGASKFWRAWLCKDMDAAKIRGANPMVVVLEWGKIGTQGHKEAKSFDWENEAIRYMAGRLRDKRNKGYVPATGEYVPPTITKPVSANYVETEWDLL